MVGRLIEALTIVVDAVFVCVVVVCLLIFKGGLRLWQFGIGLFSGKR